MSMQLSNAAGFSFAVDPRGRLVDPGDEKLIVTFYMEFVEDPRRSKMEGRPVGSDAPYVRIQVPGDKNNIVERPAGEADKQRFPKQWARFQATETVAVDGTPLELWPIMSRPLARQLKSVDIHTVEQLAAVHDGNLGALGPGAREMRDRAKAYIDEAKDNAAMDRLARENSELKARLERMESTVRDLSARQLAPNPGEVRAQGPALVENLTPPAQENVSRETLPPDIDAPAQGLLPRRGPGRPRKDAA